MLCVELHILCSELLNSFCLGYSFFLFQMCFMLVIYFQNNSCIPFLLVAINCGKEKNVKLLSRGKERLFKSQKKKKKKTRRQISARDAQMHLWLFLAPHAGCHLLPLKSLGRERCLMRLECGVLSSIRDVGVLI